MQKLEDFKVSSNDEYVIAQLESQADMYANFLYITIKNKYWCFCFFV